MNIIAVDDEPAALRALARATQTVAPTATVTCFGSTEEALAYAQNHPTDVAFLDIEMDETNGMSLAKRLLAIRKTTNIIFVTGYAQYKAGALDLRASGYIMKPVNPARVREELDNLRNPAAQAPPAVRIRCFGSFAVFVGGKPLLFPQAKAKELFALLVHNHGAAISNGEIAAVLWEDKISTHSMQSNVRNVVAQLTAILKNAGAADVLCKARNSMAIDIQKVSCDYFDYLRDKKAGAHLFTGEYLADYSWAEATLASLLEHASR